MTDLLVLVPTKLELDIVRPLLDVDSVELCGFGPIAAAARTAQLIATYQPQQVLLLGVAGSYTETLEVGSAYAFDSVACHGVGVGLGGEFRPAGKLGWPHWAARLENDSLGDVISLTRPTGLESAGQLLTVCAASNRLEDVRRRTESFPNAVAEDMEGFGAACACQMSNVTITIVRGISNRAGNRQHDEWEIEPALQAAAEIARRLVNQSAN